MYKFCETIFKSWYCSLILSTLPGLAECTWLIWHWNWHCVEFHASPTTRRMVLKAVHELLGQTSYLVLVVEHAHNFVEIRNLLPRIPMAIVIDMFPLGHVFWQYVNIYTVLGQHYNDMLIGLHHVAFVQRNSGYNTFMNAKMCTNRNSDVEKRLSRR